MASSSLAEAVALQISKTQQVLDAALVIAGNAITQDDLASVAGQAGQAALAADQAVQTAQIAVDGLAARAKTSDLAAATGAASIGASAPLPVPFLQTLSDITNGNPVSLFRFTDPLQANSIRSFSSVYDAAPALRLAGNSGAKRIVADYGLFNLESSVDLTSGFTLEGAGDGTVFHQRTVTTKGSLGFKSSSASNFVDGVRLLNFVLQCTTGTFSEQQHLITLDGVRNAVLSGLRLYGFRGDGIYLGSGGAGEERHNQNVRITQCVLDGINNDNRNAISVIDVDGLTIDHNWFLRCTRANMPGPIDFEPDTAAYHVIRNARVMFNHLRACGGNVAEVSVYTPSTVTAPATNILVQGNDSDGYVGTGAFFHYRTNRVPTATSKECDIRLLRNEVRNGNRPWDIRDGKRIEIASNGWSDMKQSALLGYTGATDFTREVTIRDDAYTRIGTAGRIGIAIFNVARLTMDNVDLIDCGDGNAGSYAIDFNSGASSGVDMDRVKVSSPTGKTIVAIQKEAGHTFTPSTNRFMRSTLNSLPNNFQAEESDELETAFTMPVAGQGTAGTWTPTASFARYRRLGKETIVRAKVAGTLSGSSGALIFGLPVALQQDGSNQETDVVLTVDGGSGYSTGGQVGLMTPGLSLGGVTGVIRTYSTATGGLTLLAAPAGAFTAYIYARYKNP